MRPKRTNDPGGRVRALVAAALAAIIALPAGSAAQALPPKRHVVADFNGDGRSDLAVWDIATGYWRFATICDDPPELSCGFSHGHLTGSTARAIATPGDYDGDGRGDPAFYDQESGLWRIVPLSGQAVELQLGTTGDIAVQADYDGDGSTDPAVFRPAEALWLMANSSSEFELAWFGEPGDRPAPGDYDGDGRADLAVFRPADGWWFVRRSSDGVVTRQRWGAAGDEIVQADYDGDGRTDLAVFRRSTGQWWILQSSDDNAVVVSWGGMRDVLVPADYDGDGRTEIAVYQRPDGSSASGSLGVWRIYGTAMPINFGNLRENPVIALNADTSG